MPVSWKPIEEIPSGPSRRGPRDSECLRAYQAARDSPSRKLVVEGTQEEVGKFYKSFIQWRARHREEPVRTKKDGARVYIWIEDEAEGEAGSEKRPR